MSENRERGRMFVRESIEGSTENPEKVRDFAYRHEVDIDDKKEIYFVVIERMRVFEEHGNAQAAQVLGKSSGEKKSITRASASG